jgi:hypothetical protein
LGSDLNDTSQLILKGADPLLLTEDNQNILEIAEEPFKNQLKGVLSANTFNELEQELNRRRLLREGGPHNDIHPAREVIVNVASQALQSNSSPARPLLQSFQNYGSRDDTQEAKETTPLLEDRDKDKRVYNSV